MEINIVVDEKLIKSSEKMKLFIDDLNEYGFLFESLQYIECLREECKQRAEEIAKRLDKTLKELYDFEELSIYQKNKTFMEGKLNINIFVDGRILKNENEDKNYVFSLDEYKFVMIILQNILEKRILSFKDIAKCPEKYYGKEVKGYECANSDSIDKWLLFLVNKDAYIISSDYISEKYMPRGKHSSKIDVNHTGYYSFGEVIDDYDDEFENQRAISYLLDEGAWRGYVGKNGKYAIGSPTLQMFAESYNNICYNQKFEYLPLNHGYVLKWRKDIRYEFNLHGLRNFKNLYVIIKRSKADGMCLASPSSYNTSYILNVEYNGNINYKHSSRGYHQGVRPIVCLKSDVKIIEELDGSLRII